MEVRNCRKCGRIFNYVSGPIVCQNCREATEKKFQEVKEYIRENITATVPQISKECNVETGQIQQWIREERLVFSEESNIGINCEKCGAMIKTGRFCDACKNSMANSLSNSIRTQKAPEAPKKQEKDNSNKMRFLNH